MTFAASRRIRPAHRPAFMHHALAAAVLVSLQVGAAAQQGQLQTINVTAERRVENIKDVPSSISALQGETLDVLNSSGQDVRVLSGRVPSLNIESSFGRAFPRFYIRGYGNTDFRLNASQPVSLVYDDVVQENPILKGFPAFDLESVEVLRGPQGTLFGRNTPAGVVKFNSVKPGKKAEGYVSASVGTYSTVNLEAAATLPISDTVSTRISLLSQSRSDWVKNLNPSGPTRDLEGYRDSALRAQMLIEPSKDLSALLKVHARDLDGSSRVFRANIIQKGTNDLIGGFDESKVSYDGMNESRLKIKGANARLRIGLGPELTLNSITGYDSLTTYNRGDIDGGNGNVFSTPPNLGIPFSSETADGVPTHRQLTQEFRFESTSRGPMNWQAGLFLFNEDYKVESFSYDSPFGGTQDGYQRVRQKNTASALFGAINYAVSPALGLRGGLRYTQDKKTFTVEDYRQSGFAPCIGPTLGIPGSGPKKCTLAELTALEPDGSLTATPKDNKLSWDLSGTYALDKDTNLYARAATGFRGSSVQGAGAFNGKSVANAETNTSVEAGVKADLMNRRARVNFNVFSYTVKDLQLTAVGGGSNANILINARKASGQGFELDGQFLVTDNLVASVGVGYNDTKIKDPNLFVGICASCTVTDPTKSVTNTATGQVSTVALIDGNALPQAPRITTSFTLKYSQPMAGGEAYVFTDWVYRSKVNFFLYESVEFTGKALLEGGLRVGYTWGNGRYDAAVFARNITNQIRAVGGIDFNNLTGFINEPRTLGVQARLSF